MSDPAAALATVTAPAAADEWVAVHAFHHGDLDPLLVEAVAPLVAGRRWFFLRYWDGGPHLRVRVAAPPGEADDVRAALVDGLAGYLAGHPAAATMSAEAYRQLAAELAAREGATGSERELRPPGSVTPEPYRPEHDVYGTGAPLAHVEQHFVESSELALEVVAGGASAERRRGLALVAVLLLLAEVEPDLPALAGSMAAGGTDDWSPAGPGPAGTDGQREQLAAAFESQRDRLRATARQVWATAAQGGGGGSVTDRWLRSVRTLHRALEGCAERGELGVPPASSPLAGHLRTLPASRQVVTAILLRCGHLLNNRIGVGPTEETYVTYLSARVLADLGANPEDRP